MEVFLALWEGDKEMSLIYSEYEIIKEYGEAADKLKQINILAELNCCSRDEIIAVLYKNGIPLPKGVSAKNVKQENKRGRTEPIEWTDSMIKRLRDLYESKVSRENIAEVFGVSPSSVRRALEKFGIKEKAGRKPVKKTGAKSRVDEDYIEHLECLLENKDSELKSQVAVNKSLLEELRTLKERSVGSHLSRDVICELMSAKGLLDLAIMGFSKCDVQMGVHAAILNARESIAAVLEVYGDEGRTCEGTENIKGLPK